MVNSRAIKARAQRLGITQKHMADVLGIRQSTVNQKINNKRPMSLKEAEKLADLLIITNNQFSTYFFSVSSGTQKVKVRKKV